MRSERSERGVPPGPQAGELPLPEEGPGERRGAGVERWRLAGWRGRGFGVERGRKKKR